MRFTVLVSIVITSMLTGCAGATGNINATDTTERGLSYVALAIITSAIIKAVCNK